VELAGMVLARRLSYWHDDHLSSSAEPSLARPEPSLARPEPSLARPEPSLAPAGTKHT